MASINSREMVDKIIANNGRYSSDPQVVEILEYENIFDGKITYKLIYKRDDAAYIRKNLVCRSMKSIWKAVAK